MNTPAPASPVPPRGALDLAGTVTRGDFTLDAALTVRCGEVVAVIGPNGSGKTTLLDTIAGFAPLTRGHLRVGEQCWDDGERRLAPAHRHVAMMTAAGDLFPHLSALENVAFGLRARGMRRRDARVRARTELAAVGLPDKESRRPRELSSGQAQRVALARALAPTPSVLLLDEPLSAIDAAGRGELRSLLSQRLSTAEAATLLVTHDPIEALTLADRLVVLDAGRVAQIGTPADVVRQPRTPFAARLVGLNVWRGRLDGACLVTDAGARVIAAAPPDPNPQRSDERAFAAFAPNAVSLWLERPTGSPRNTWAVRVITVEHAGTRARVHLAGEADLVAEVTLAAVAALHLTPGTDVFATLKATDVTLYR